MKNRSIIRSEINHYYRAKVISWLASHVKDKREVPEDFPTHLYLGAPANENDIINNPEAFLSFCKEWSTPIPAGHVEFVERTFDGMGTVKVPLHLVFDTPDELASWAGHKVEYHSAIRCLSLILQEIPELIDSALNVINSLANLDWIDFERMVAVSKWFCAHREGLYLTRQIPIRGVDTRWFEIHSHLLLGFLRDYLELNPYRKDLIQLGIVPPPALVRIVVFDEEISARVGGMKLFACALDEMANLNLRPDRIVFMDNISTAVALPKIKGTMAIITPNSHIREVCEIEWVAKSQCQYLGSIDLKSFAILHNLRLYLPNIESVLMDEQTMLSNQDLWTDNEDYVSNCAPVALNQSETHLYRCLLDGVYGHNIRLDLERLPLALIATALGSEDESLAREIAANGIDGLTPNKLHNNDPYPELQQEINQLKEQAKAQEHAQVNSSLKSQEPKEKSSDQQQEENLA